MDELKNLFNGEALTWEQLSEKLNSADKKTLNLANLASGEYVAKGKYEAKASELATAQATIADLQDAAKKWDGVDVEKLKGDFTALQAKYDSDLTAARLDNVINMALVDAKAKDAKLVKSLLDMSIIKQDGETVLGLNDQLDKIRQSHDYLFGSDAPAARISSGGAHSNTNSDNLDELSDAEYYATIKNKEKTT